MIILQEKETENFLNTILHNYKKCLFSFWRLPGKHRNLRSPFFNIWNRFIRFSQKMALNQAFFYYSLKYLATENKNMGKGLEAY